MADDQHQRALVSLLSAPQPQEPSSPWQAALEAAMRDRQAKETQAQWPGWKQKTVGAFENIMHALGGFAGVPGTPETGASLVGELLSAGVPMLGGLKAARAATAAKPIKAYHGSPHDFDAMSLAKAGTTTDEGLLGRGLYLSTDKAVAARSPHKYEAEVSLENPLRVDFPKWTADKKRITTDALGLSPTASAEEMRTAAIAKGHDGVVLDYSPVGYNQKEIAVFDEKLISIVKKYGIAGAVSAGLIDQAQANQLHEQGYQ
jgi:hypothetical protein